MNCLFVQHNRRFTQRHTRPFYRKSTRQLLFSGRTLPTSVPNIYSQIEHKFSHFHTSSAVIPLTIFSLSPNVRVKGWFLQDALTSSIFAYTTHCEPKEKHREREREAAAIRVCVGVCVCERNCYQKTAGETFKLNSPSTLQLALVLLQSVSL